MLELFVIFNEKEVFVSRLASEESRKFARTVAISNGTLKSIITNKSACQYLGFVVKGDGVTFTLYKEKIEIVINRANELVQKISIIDNQRSLEKFCYILAKKYLTPSAILSIIDKDFYAAIDLKI